MGTLQSGIELYDGFTAPLNNIITALNLTVSAFENMQRVSGNEIDTRSLEGMRDAADQATMAFQNMQDELSRIGPSRGTVAGPAVPPAEVPVIWKSDSLDVFTTSGIDRYEQEIFSANSMLEKLKTTQSAITQQAQASTFLSPAAITDIQNLQSRIQNLQTAIAEIEQNSLDIGSDEANAQLEHLRGQLAQTLSCQENLNNAMAGMDAGNINQAFLQLSQTVGNVERSIRDGFSQPVEIPVTWKTQDIPVFTDTGIERFQAELESANFMMKSLTQAQQRIGAQAANANIFPPNAAADLNSLQIRIQAIQSRMAQIASNPMNIGSDRANAQLEQLRGQLAQAVQAQEALNHAVENMDVQGANEAYNRLSQIVGGTERHIRDNVDEQGRFNDAIRQGANEANHLTQMVGRAVAAYATMHTLSAVLGLSDQLTSTTARLNLMNDGLQTTQDLQNMIYLSAERSRGSYQATADAVSKLGLMAGDAFGSSREIVDFMEQVNKQFRIAGTAPEGIKAAMLQLTQAMGSGILRGEEYNSILEQAPNIIQAIADYMDVSKGQLKDMAAEGAITADIVKAAMFAAADETNAKFESMPKTFEQIGTSIQNTALMSFQPVLARMNEIANNDSFQKVVNSTIDGLSIMAQISLNVFDLMTAGAGAVIDNWSWISPIVYGVTAALLGYTAVLGVYKATQAVANGITAAAAIQANVHAAAQAMQTGATFAQTAAQYGLNTALLACPVTWIIASIIGIIALIYAVVAAINHFKGTSVSATGIIAGVFAVLGAQILNHTVIPVQNGFAMAANFIGNVFNNPVAAVEILFYDMCLTVIGYIKNMAAAIEAVINKIPGVTVDITSGLDNFYSGLEKAQQEVKDESGWVEYVKKMDFIDYSDAASAGYSFGQGIEDKIADFSLKDFFGVNGLDMSKYMAEGGVTDLANDVSNIVDNTGTMADSLKSSDEELKYLRDIAERETINRFTMADITIKQTNHNSINSGLDLDGIVEGLTDGPYEAIDKVAEGTHT